MARFTLPRDIYHGKGSLSALKDLQGKRAIICVGGGSMKRGGFLQRAEDYLREAGMEVELFEGIESDPSVETVMRGAERKLSSVQYLQHQELQQRLLLFQSSLIIKKEQNIL